MLKPPVVSRENGQPPIVGFEPNQNSSPQPMKRKFGMPLKGDKFEIFQPLYDMHASEMNKQLLASPNDFIETFDERISWADTMVEKPPEFQGKSVKEHAVLMYLETIKSFVSGAVYNSAELTVRPATGTSVHKTSKFNLDARIGGDDWTYAGDTMTGFKRLDNVFDLLSDVIFNKVDGDYIETGVWRGGSSIFAKAVLSVLEPNTTRMSYVCDSFAGLPPGERSLNNGDRNWDNTPYLEIPANVVANNFIKYGMLDSNVVFAKGFFNETMPQLSPLIEKLAVMRLDVSLLTTFLMFCVFYLIIYSKVTFCSNLNMLRTKYYRSTIYHRAICTNPR